MTFGIVADFMERYYHWRYKRAGSRLKKILRKANPDSGPCFIHTFHSFWCSPCYSLMVLNGLMYGNVHFKRMTGGYFMLDGRTVLPQPIGFLDLTMYGYPVEE